MMKITIRWKSSTEEWTVRFWQLGRMVAEYFTDDQQDAIDTMVHMARERRLVVWKPLVGFRNWSLTFCQ